MHQDLIVDVGMHTGKDTAFYLRKGFRVIAIEANPNLVEQAQQTFAASLNTGQLIIEPVAVAPIEGKARFYVNKQKTDWGTLDKRFADRNTKRGADSVAIEVASVRFERILEKYGVPYYLKIDIEGADLFCVQALHSFKSRPKYISLETSLTNLEETFHEMAHLHVLGYRRFKIINQALNHTYTCPNPPREGQYVNSAFDGEMTGPFGEETAGNWLSADETYGRLRDIVHEHALYSPEGKYYGTLRHRLQLLLKR